MIIALKCYYFINIYNFVMPTWLSYKTCVQWTCGLLVTAFFGQFKIQHMKLARRFFIDVIDVICTNLIVHCLEIRSSYFVDSVKHWMQYWKITILHKFCFVIFKLMMHVKNKARILCLFFKICELTFAIVLKMPWLWFDHVVLWHHCLILNKSLHS